MNSVGDLVGRRGVQAVSRNRAAGSGVTHGTAEPYNGPCRVGFSASGGYRQPQRQIPFRYPGVPIATSQQPVAPEGYKLKKKKPIYKRVWFWLLAIVVLIIIAAAVGGGGGDEPTVSGEAASPGGAASDAPAADAPTFQGQQEGDTVAQAGQSITLGDVVTTTTPLVEGDATLGPTLCSTVTIVNNGEDQASFNGAFEWALQDPQGASRNTTLGGSNSLLSAGELAPGGTVTGDVCFDNPTAAPGQYAVIYEPAFSFSGDRAVWVNTR